jgi:hypothetical protein
VDSERFDNLTRILASGQISRRGTLKAILTGAAGAILSGPLTGKSISSASAATLQAISCTNSNTFQGTCQEYQDYARACGPYLAETGEHCGGITGTSVYGCTVPLLAQEFTPYPKTLQCHQISKNLFRCQQDYRFVVSLLSMSSASLIFVPDGSECCVEKCQAEADAFNIDTVQHEAEHASHIQATITATNNEFARVRVFGEGSKSKTAKAQLDVNAANKAVELSNLLSTRIEVEPSDRPLQCSECAPPSETCETCDNGDCAVPPNAKPCGDACCGSCQICDNGTCRNCNACETCDSNGTCVNSCPPEKPNCVNGVCASTRCGPGKIECHGDPSSQYASEVICCDDGISFGEPVFCTTLDDEPGFNCRVGAPDCCSGTADPSVCTGCHPRVCCKF